VAARRILCHCFPGERGGKEIYFFFACFFWALAAVSSEQLGANKGVLAIMNAKGKPIDISARL